MTIDSGRTRASGFTLLEVMVALAVVSLGLIAVFNGIIQISDQSTHLRERAFAHWVAMNELTRMRVGGAMPEVSEFDGDVDFAEISYRWEATVSETGVENLRRIDMRVSYADAPDDVLAEAVGFVAPRPASAGAQTAWAGNRQPGRGEREDDGDEESGDDGDRNPGAGDGNGNDDGGDNEDDTE